MSQKGDIFLTRNTDELNQTKKSYWQHAAMSNGFAIMEGQAEPKQVIMVKEDSFLRRNPERVLLRPKDPEIGRLASLAMEKYIGSKYNVLLRNCVTYVKWAYMEALGYNPYWFTPDDIYRSKLFTEVEHFKNYENYVQPADWYEGRIV